LRLDEVPLALERPQPVTEHVEEVREGEIEQRIDLARVTFG
jgi:hypothetical protein